MAEDTPNAAPDSGGGGTQTVDWQNDPDFHNLPLAEKHKVLMQVDPDYAQLPAPERSKALNAIHYGQGQAGDGTGKEFTDERDAPKESTGSHMLTTVGHQIRDLALSSAKPFTDAYDTYQGSRAKGAGVGESLARGAAHGLYDATPVIDGLAVTGNALGAPKEYQQHREKGYNPVYSAVAPAAAKATGVNLPAMEHAADIGDTAGVVSEAAVPALEAAIPEAGHQFMEPGAVGGKWLENRRQTRGASNVVEGLDTPGGKGGVRADKMQEDVEVAKGDLADIQRESPISGKDGKAHAETVEKIEDRMEKLWDEGHKPGIERHKDAPINHQALVDAATAEITPEAADAAPGEAQAAQKWITEQVAKPRTLGSADNLIREINADLKSPGAENRYGPLQVRAKQAVVRALRTEVDRVLTESGEQGVKDVNRRYGALGNIAGRMNERAVQLARAEAKGGVLPDWVHTYMFLHPGAGVTTGVGIKAAEALKGSVGGSLRRGMRQLGKSNLSSPVGDIPPPGWRPGVETDPGHMLNAPPPDPIQMPQPGQNGSGPVNDPTARWANPKGLLKSPVRGLLPAPRVEGMAPGSAEVAHPEMFPNQSLAVEPQTNVQRGEGGRMQKVATGMGKPQPIGHTAEGGNMYPPAEPVPQRAARPTERRQEMNMTRVSPTGEERRAYPPAERQGTGTREALIKTMKGVLDDVNASASEKAKAKVESTDLKKGARKAGRAEAREKGVKGGTDSGWSLKETPDHEMPEELQGKQPGEFHYTMHDETGKKTSGVVWGRETDKGKTLDISFIGSDDDPEFNPGAKALRDVMDDLKANHPDAEKIEWHRASGSHAERGDTNKGTVTPLKARGSKMYSGPDRRMGDDAGVGPHGVERRGQGDIFQARNLEKEQNDILKDPKSTEHDKAIARRNLADMKSHPEDIGYGQDTIKSIHEAQEKAKSGETGRLSEKEATDRILADPEKAKRWNDLDPNVKAQRKVRDQMLVDEQQAHLALKKAGRKLKL